jgi:hypothetical protein
MFLHFTKCYYGGKLKEEFTYKKTTAMRHPSNRLLLVIYFIDNFNNNKVNQLNQFLNQLSDY